MRTIKFRGKRVDNGEWVFGNYIDLSKIKTDWHYIEFVNNGRRERHIVTLETVGQFTGLYDKNGKEIYEGDILTVGENLTCEIIYIGNNSDDYGDEINCAFHAKVFIHNKLIPLDGYLKKYCEVIGNTYENQELLKN